MTLKHKDRLSAVDASFLTQEGPNAHMHVGAALIFEGPPPKADETLRHIKSRLHLVPRFRQKLAFPPLESGRPVWIDDPDFNLEYHIRHTALPPPGSEEQLKQLIGRVVSQQLDRTKPLWEIYLVEGLTENRFALISKTHHCLVDGIAGVDLTTVMFDTKPVPQQVAPPEEPWTPSPEPSPAELVADGLRERVGQPLRLIKALRTAVRRPRYTARRVTEATEAIGEVAWATLNPAPDTPLNVEIGPHRRFEWVRCDLDDFKLIKNSLGGTVNDVVLAVTAGALGRFIRHRGQRTEGLELRGLVPVSIRTEDEHGELGNRIAAVRGPLPVYARDPAQRMRLAREAMAGVKQSKQALGAETLTAMNDFMPPTLLSQASRINFSTRLFNLIVTNVPGPQIPLYIQGRELLDVFPIAFLPRKHSLAVAIISYNGKLNFGLLADYDAVDDVSIFGEEIEASVTELLKVARSRSRKRRAAPVKAARAKRTTGKKRAPSRSRAKSRTAGKK